MDDGLETRAKKATWVHCRACWHQWIGFYLPMVLADMAKFRNLACPRCAGGDVYLGKTPRRKTP